jgi:hypothetical protein
MDIKGAAIEINRVSDRNRTSPHESLHGADFPRAHAGIEISVLLPYVGGIYKAPLYKDMTASEGRFLA